MEPTSQKKSPAKKTTTKKKLPNYNYNQLTIEDVKQLGKYFVAELQKIEKAAPGLVPEISKLFNKSVEQPNKNLNAYVDIDYSKDMLPTYNSTNPIVHQSTMKLPAMGSINSSSSGMPGSTLDMPMFGGLTLTPKVDIIEPPIVEDNSEHLISEVQTLLNQ